MPIDDRSPDAAAQPPADTARPTIFLPFDAVTGLDELEPGDEVTLTLRGVVGDRDEDAGDGINVEVMSGQTGSKNVALAGSRGGDGVRPVEEPR
jgi:hypothetical protein